MSDIPGLQEGVEAVKVFFDGAEICFRITGGMLNWSMDKLIRATGLMISHVQKRRAELAEGEVSFKNLVSRNHSGIGMLQIEQEHFGVLKEFVKKAGLSYSIMPDINKKDIYMEVAFPESQGEAFRYFIAQHADIAKSYTYGEYFDNALTEDIEEEIRKLGEGPSAFAESVKNDKTSHTQGQVEIDRSLLKESQYRDWVLLAVPNTENEYIRVDTNDVTERDGRLYVKLLDDVEHYVFDKDERIVYENNRNKRIKTGELKAKIAQMPEVTRENKEPQQKVKGILKIINKTADGQEQSRIFKTGTAII